MGIVVAKQPCLMEAKTCVSTVEQKNYSSGKLHTWISVLIFSIHNRKKHFQYSSSKNSQPHINKQCTLKLLWSACFSFDCWQSAKASDQTSNTVVYVLWLKPYPSHCLFYPSFLVLCLSFPLLSFVRVNLNSLNLHEWLSAWHRVQMPSVISPSLNSRLSRHLLLLMSPSLFHYISTPYPHCRYVIKAEMPRKPPTHV